jgi:hypothetical protein
LTKFSQKTVLTGLRVIAALLLTSVAWGSTVEFTHHHGLRRNVRLAQADNARTAQQQSEAARIADPESRQSSSRSNLGAECSICQLHHNLSTTLLSEYAAAATNQSFAARSQTVATGQFLGFSATLHGRAPPSHL